jgi:hypothetical protein
MMSRCASSSSPKCSRISLLRCTHSAHAHWGTQARACANDVQTIQTRRATREQQHERTGARAQSATADGCAAPPRCHPGRQTLCRCRAAAATHTHTHTHTHAQHNTHTRRATQSPTTRACAARRASYGRARTFARITYASAWRGIHSIACVASWTPRAHCAER